MEQLQRQARRLLAAFLAVLLAGSLAGVLPASAWAEPADDGQAAVDSAQQALDAAEARMGEINAEYDALTAQVDDLQTQIDESTALAMEAQQAMLEGRAALGDVAVSEYRDGASANLLMLLIDSKSFDDLLRNMEYVTQIMDFQAEEVARQRERKEAFDAASEQLNTQKNEQEAALAAQEQKRSEAQAVVEEASAHLDEAKADHAERLAELAAQAEAMRQAEQADDGGSNAEGANTVDRQEVVGDDAPVKPNPKPVEDDDDEDEDDNAGNVSDKPSSDAGSDSGSSSASGWKTGVASAYGGSTDPYTPNPGTTATGAVCDDNSMGVAVPMSLTGYRKLFGRTVEISWNGKTVYATVNDCGGMGGGSRALDLQPGVWKAFGFSSCRAWGLRTVNYRFL
ncbi:hypothetical protein VJ918_03105 [Adlercreutzia sp. R21]|uniref:hypothetical protein n=1 Tax=Adlercreutzia wanghongyangiae TaxID=3111451 RepID=UPI002DBC1A51|nr:hypothetical protein [Adlercreutzia sp. R21]MEC4183790.1 hypothetical protein [Adlercreutzia sp. R21]